MDTDGHASRGFAKPRRAESSAFRLAYINPDLLNGMCCQAADLWVGVNERVGQRRESLFGVLTEPHQRVRSTGTKVGSAICVFQAVHESWNDTAGLAGSSSERQGGSFIDYWILQCRDQCRSHALSMRAEVVHLAKPLHCEISVRVRGVCSYREQRRNAVRSETDERDERYLGCLRTVSLRGPFNEFREYQVVLWPKSCKRAGTEQIAFGVSQVCPGWSDAAGQFACYWPEQTTVARLGGAHPVEEKWDGIGPYAAYSGPVVGLLDPEAQGLAFVLGLPLWPQGGDGGDKYDNNRGGYNVTPPSHVPEGATASPRRKPVTTDEHRWTRILDR